MLLYEHPEGMTVDDVHNQLRDGWLYTDDYRAYQQRLTRTREERSQGGSAIARRVQYAALLPPICFI